MKRSSQDTEEKSSKILRRGYFIQKIPVKYGCFTPNYLISSGFEYTGQGDAARCNRCETELSNWTADMKPHNMHKRECPYLLSIKTEEAKELNILSGLCENNLLMQVRRRGFSSWPSNKVPSSEQMIEAGFFSCDSLDRVICIYCNLICQQWTAHVDIPYEVHKTLSPNCLYVKTKLVKNINTNVIVPASSRHPTYSNISKRYNSFNIWNPQNLPPIEDFVQSGFFYTGRGTLVTCFYCNGSLQNWSLKDKPIYEHVRFYPICAYAKQLCGDRMYREIQIAKRVAEELSRNNTIEKDKSTIDRLVAARLDLPVSQRMLNNNFRLSIIKRCWENQLLLRGNDYVSDCDLYMACLILKRQLENIGGKKENLCIPSVKMKQIIESESSLQSFQHKNVCRVCLCEERKVACIPCGHLSACISCSESLKCCPVCNRQIESKIKIYT